MSVSSAVVLAAGEGVRLRPLTRNRPKPMLPAGTRPVLEHVFDQLIDAGLGSITVVVGYRGDRIRSHFGSTYRDAELTYVEQHHQLGTAHALAVAAPVVDGPTVVVNGDQLVDRRIVEAVVAGHDASPVTLGVLERQAIGEYGGVLLENGAVSELVENPTDERPYRLNAGVYVVEPSLFETIERLEPVDGELSLVDAINALLAAGESVRGVRSDGYWLDATYPWDLLDVSRSLFDAGIVQDAVAESATVHESAVVLSPTVVDRGCEIGPGAVVGPDTCLGENVTIGSNAVVKRSVIDAETRIGPNATVDDCVTGVGVDVGHGSIVPGGPSDVRVGDRFFEGEPIGALLADRVTDRGGVTYVPGTIVGAAAEIDAGAVVHGTIPADAEVRS
ncbi:sugar phosphate nucleotidyltransferase [Halobiforma nitratireducens]|uniref:Bifunctional protein GlmU n=1 Tax=Halobiforma nitratireducens JCM 10879 TaxID=1227454 RepID=M0LXB6_9EURY|nr:sugar phosphate nucleotidyltransferase [Halobiforma nitratireducens]EMA37818.1 nucleotidyl transferase [Halobiforma nitratireducens JCM 10879]